MKQTEVGLIPDDWEIQTIEKTCSVFTGGECPENWSKTQNDIFQYPIYANGRECYGYTNNYKINNDAVCISSIGENTGDVFFYEKCFTPIIRLKVIIPKKNNIDTKCLFYILTKYRIDGTKNGGIPNINAQDVKELKFPLPPFAEQQKIAEALSDIDSLICGIEEEIEKKKNIKTGAMQELLTGKRRLPGFAKSDKTKITELWEIPEDWEVINFGEKVQILRGGSPRPIEAYLTKNANGINWIKIGDVKPNDKYIRQTEEKIIPEGKKRSREVKKGDFILSNSMSFGRPYILDIDGCIHDGWLTIQNYSETFDKDFLYYLLGSEEVFSQYITMAAGSSVQNLNKEKVAGLQLKLPSCKEEQIAIAKIFSDMDEEINELETKLSKYKKIKDGMMQQLLTGKIRLN